MVKLIALGVDFEGEMFVVKIPRVLWESVRIHAHNRNVARWVVTREAFTWYGINAESIQKYMNDGGLPREGEY